MEITDLWSMFAWLYRGRVVATAGAGHPSPAEVSHNIEHCNSYANRSRDDEENHERNATRT